jgi:hypothetical protein
VEARSRGPFKETVNKEVLLFLEFGGHNCAWPSFYKLDFFLVRSTFDETLRRTARFTTKHQGALEGRPFVFLSKVRNAGAAYAALQCGEKEKFV